MAVTLVATGSAGGNLVTLSLAWSSLTATPAAGDVAFLIWAQGSAQTVTSDLSGWTLVDSQNSTNGAMRTRIYRRVCTGSESGSISGTMNGANRQCFSVVVLRGVNTTSPVNASAFRHETVTNTSHVCPNVTPTVAGCMIVTMIGERSSTGSTTISTPGGSGYTVRVHSGTAAAGSGGTICGIADDGFSTPHSANVAVTPANLVGSASVIGVTTWSLAVLAGGSQVAGSASAALGGVTATAVGRRTTIGTASASLGGLTAAATGRRRVNGVASAVTAFQASGTGRRTVSGAASATSALTASATGRRTVHGNASAASELTASAAGTRRVQGAASATLGTLNASAAGKRTVQGVAAALAVLTASAAGSRTVPGTASALFTLTAAATGRTTVHGTATAVFEFTASATGTSPGIDTTVTVGPLTRGWASKMAVRAWSTGILTRDWSAGPPTT